MNRVVGPDPKHERRVPSPGDLMQCGLDPHYIWLVTTDKRWVRLSDGQVSDPATIPEYRILHYGSKITLEVLK